MPEIMLFFDLSPPEMIFPGHAPGEYAAPVAEDYRGPVFIQGDQFQVSPERWGTQPTQEHARLRTLERDTVLADIYKQQRKYLLGEQKQAIWDIPVKTR